jgi:Tol biopolymer transport system component
VARLSSGLIAVGAAAIAVIIIGVVLRPEAPFGGPGSPSPAPSGSANGSLSPIALTGQIAFERTVDGNTDIYLMNLDRTGLVRLTDDPAPDRNPGWSPDGERIVFTRVVAGAGDIWIMNADGSEQRQLTVGVLSEDDGRFSPDGSTIAYLRGHEGSAELRGVDPDGPSDVLFLELTQPFTGGIGWAGDGQAILFGRDLSTSGGQIDIMSVDFASKMPTALTTEPGDDGSFAVSPSGTTIAFQSDRSPGGIFLMDADGSNVRHVIGSWTDGTPLSWSPDGQRLVIGQLDGWLYLVRTDGTELAKWTEGDGTVAWRPIP